MKRVRLKKKAKSISKQPKKQLIPTKKAVKIDSRSSQQKKKSIDPHETSALAKGATSAPEHDVQSESGLPGKKSAAPSAPKVVSASPAYAKNPNPPYPRAARRRGYEGIVLLKVLVSREGRVDDLLVFKSSGHAVLDRSAVKAVREWLFEPGNIDGKPAKMWVKVPVRFELKGR